MKPGRIGRRKEEISLGEIFSDIGLDKLQGNFQQTNGLISVPVYGFEAEIRYAIDLLVNLAALMLECKVSGSVNISDLLEDEESDCNICMIATSEENEFINKALMDFVAEPLSYDLAEMMSEAEILEMANVCEEIRKEL